MEELVSAFELVLEETKRKIDTDLSNPVTSEEMLFEVFREIAKGVLADSIFEFVFFGVMVF